MTIISILDDEDFISTLENSKEVSNDAKDKLEQAKIIEVKINETLASYIEVAARASDI